MNSKRAQLGIFPQAAQWAECRKWGTNCWKIFQSNLLVFFKQFYQMHQMLCYCNGNFMCCIEIVALNLKRLRNISFQNKQLL